MSQQEPGSDEPIPVSESEADELFSIIRGVQARFGTDDDFLASTIANGVELGRIGDRQDAIIERLSELNNELSQVGEGAEAYPFEFSTNVPASTPTDDPATTERTIPDGGRLFRLIVGWPDGADNAVGVQFRTKSGERYFPRNDEDDYIAANDFTHPFEIDAPVGEDDTLVAEFVNGDSTNNHFVNVIAMVRFDNGGGGGE